MNKKDNQTAQSVQQKYQTILFFKSYLKYLKKIIDNSNTLNDIQNSIFDLKKVSGNVSLELFLQRIISYFKCGSQAYICALCFIDRFLESDEAQQQNIKLNIKNIFKIISVALLISTKNFDDFYYTNKYYARVCGLTLQQLNQLQKQFLRMIDYNVFIDSDSFKEYSTIVQGYKLSFIYEHNKTDIIYENQRSKNTHQNESYNQKENIQIIKLEKQNTCVQISTDQQNSTKQESVKENSVQVQAIA